MEMVRLTKLCVSGLACSMLWGCVTLNQEGKKRESGDPVVVRAGAEDAVIAKIDRESWIQLRKAETDEERKLYTALGTRDWPVAEEDARGYLLKHPKNRTALSVLSTAEAMQFNFSLALYYARLVQKYYGDNAADVENFAGLSRMHVSRPAHSDFIAAQRHFENAFDGGAGQIAAGFNLGHLDLIMGNAAAAEGVFGSLRHKCDNCVDAQIGLGLAYNKQRKYEKAKETFLAVLDRNPHHPVALYRLALIEKNGFNHPGEAMDYLKKILADNTNDGLDIKRQANNLLNTMQAAEVGNQMTAQSAKGDDDPEDKLETSQPTATEAIEPVSAKSGSDGDMP